MTPHSWRVPTLVAHDVHASAFDFGWRDAYPTSLAQFSAQAVNGRIELARWNLGIRSARFTALESALSSARPIALALLGRMKAHGFSSSFDDDLDTALHPRYRLNSVDNIERPFIQQHLHLDFDQPRGQVRLSMAIVNQLAFALEGAPTAWDRFYDAYIARFGPVNTADMEEHAAELLSWLFVPSCVQAGQHPGIVL